MKDKLDYIIKTLENIKTRVELNIDYIDKLGKPNKMLYITISKGKKRLPMVKTERTIECLLVMEDRNIEKIYNFFIEKFAS